MSQPHSAPSNAVASQVAELASAAVVDAQHRKQASAERARHAAVVDSWLSRDRAVLIALALAVPVLALVITVNVMDKSLVELFTPAPTAEVSRQLTKEALDSVVKRIDSFHDDYDELPGNLGEVGLPSLGDWTWAPRSNGQYQVTVKAFGQMLAFDTSQRQTAQ